MSKVEKENQAAETVEDKKCDCGCQEGKGCNCCCCCGSKKALVKILAVLIVFLAGMGFNELLHCGRCPAKAPRPAPVMQLPAPVPAPEAGGNIIIINTDGNGSVERFIGKPEFEHRDFRKFDNDHKPCNCAQDGKPCNCGPEGRPCDCAQGKPCVKNAPHPFPEQDMPKPATPDNFPPKDAPVAK